MEKNGLGTMFGFSYDDMRMCGEKKNFSSGCSVIMLTSLLTFSRRKLDCPGHN